MGTNTRVHDDAMMNNGLKMTAVVVAMVTGSENDYHCVQHDNCHRHRDDDHVLGRAHDCDLDLDLGPGLGLGLVRDLVNDDSVADIVFRLHGGRRSIDPSIDRSHVEDSNGTVRTSDGLYVF